MGWIFWKPNYQRMELVDREDLDNDPVVRFQHKFYRTSSARMNDTRCPANSQISPPRARIGIHSADIGGHALERRYGGLCLWGTPREDHECVIRLVQFRSCH